MEPLPWRWDGLLLVALLLGVGFRIMDGPARLMAAPPDARTVTTVKLPLQCDQPVAARWEFVRAAAGPSAVAAGPELLADPRLELTVAPRGIPRWRFIGPAILSPQDTITCIEWMQTKADAVLKVHLAAQWTERSVQLTISPVLQLVPGGPLLPCTPANCQQAERWLTLERTRWERRNLWLLQASKAKMKSLPSSTLSLLKQQHGRQRAELQVMQQRLERLPELMNTLRNEDLRLELRLVSPSSGQSWELRPVDLRGHGEN
ncbi:MAG: hypothetical protein ACKOUR_20600 [Planctomycetota bacterium]